MSARSSPLAREGSGVPSTSTEPKKLSLGCGESKKPGYVDLTLVKMELHDIAFAHLLKHVGYGGFRLQVIRALPWRLR